ncbi:MAG: TonB-dependent receptor [Nitrospinae bacterium]|nr:TonB-dependent receptor [Nitrospinota bacterium]
MNIRLFLILCISLFALIYPDYSTALPVLRQTGKYSDGTTDIFFAGGSSEDKKVITSKAEEEMLLFFEEKDLIVTATKHAQSVSKAPAIATVITAEQIRNIGARNLLDVLKIVPGIGVYQEFVGLKTVEVRGIKTQNAEKVLIMIDGHRLNDPFYAGAMQIHDDLFVENIKRVEIIRGPGSALYGANAFVAVINVITKEADDINGIQATAGGGSFNTQRYNILFGNSTGSLGMEKFKVAGSFDFYKTDGPRLLVEEDAQTANDKKHGTSVSMAPGKTDDWREKYDFNLNISYGDLNFKSKYVDKKMGPYIGATYALNNESTQKLKEMFGEISYKKSLTDDLSMVAKGYIDQFEFDKDWELFPEGYRNLYPDGMRGNPKAKERTTGAELQMDYLFLKDHAVTGGGVYERVSQFDVAQSVNFNPNTGAPLSGGFQDVSNTLNYNKAVDRDVGALYIQDDWKIIKSLNMTLGIRHDNYSDFGGTTNPRAGLIWSFTDDGEIKLLYGGAFRAPNFQELYNINNPSVLGNKDLKPEKINTYEVGAGYRFGKSLEANINYFYYEIRDVIRLTPATGGNVYNNSGGTDADGVEIEFKTGWNEGSYGYANYSYQNARDKDTGIALAEVPKHRGNIGLNFGINRYLNANANLFLSESRERASGDTRSSLPSYALLDLTLTGKNFYKTAEVRAAIRNLFDKKYADPAPKGKGVTNDFPRAGIEFMIEASYRF